MPACPKPAPTLPKPRKWLPRATKPIQRSALKSSRTPIRQRNERRISRKATAYSAVLRSDFHRNLRYQAYLRSGGLCECEECRFARSVPNTTDAGAWTEIPVWFTTGGAAAHKRFRSTEGELHHDSYRYFGEENPRELGVVKWVWKTCHRRIEAEHGTRRRFLKGGK